MNVSFLSTKDGITLTDGKDKTITVREDSPIYSEVVEKITANESLTIEDLDEILIKSSPKTKLDFKAETSAGEINFVYDEEKKDLSISIGDGKHDLPLSRKFKKRIIATMKDMENIGNKFSMSIFANFIAKLIKNPSYVTIKSLWDFLDVNNVPLTKDGNFLCYKKIDYDYFDLYSHKFSNKIGTVVKMNRNEVEDNPNITCSVGLHVCSKDYLEQFGCSDPGIVRIVICEVNPKDVVSIPSDYDNAKMRVCEYKVVDELTDFDAQLAPWIMGKHKDGWLAGILPKIKDFYTKFWKLDSAEAFNWRRISVPMTTLIPAIVAQFEKAFEAEFGIKAEGTELPGEGRFAPKFRSSRDEDDFEDDDDDDDWDGDDDCDDDDFGPAWSASESILTSPLTALTLLSEHDEEATV